MKYNKTVLYVENDVDVNKVYIKFLKSIFNTVISTGDGNIALDKYFSEKPDLIITSIQIDNKNGVELIRDIHKADKEIPIIVISEHADEETLTEKFDSIVSYVFTDLVSKEELTKAIEHLFSNKPKENSETLDVINNKNSNITLKNESLIIVGIGASAGGLEALTQLMHSLPIDNNSAYIIAQHLSPTHKTMLVELLSRETRLTVKNAENKEQIIANTIYYNTS